MFSPFLFSAAHFVSFQLKLHILGSMALFFSREKAERDPRITGQIMFSICCFQDNEIFRSPEDNPKKSTCRGGNPVILQERHEEGKALFNAFRQTTDNIVLSSCT